MDADDARILSTHEKQLMHTRTLVALRWGGGLLALLFILSFSYCAFTPAFGHNSCYSAGFVEAQAVCGKWEGQPRFVMTCDRSSPKFASYQNGYAVGMKECHSDKQ